MAKNKFNRYDITLKQTQYASMEVVARSKKEAKEVARAYLEQDNIVVCDMVIFDDTSTIDDIEETEYDLDNTDKAYVPNYEFD